MSDHISSKLTEPLGEQITITLVEALYPAIKQMGNIMEQLAQDMKYQDESGINDLADSFFNRLIQHTKDYNTYIVNNIQSANELQRGCIAQSEHLLDKLIEQNKELMDQRKLEQEEHSKIMNQSFELISMQQDAISRLLENQKVLSSRLDQMQEQYRMVNEQHKQTMMLTERISHGQEQLHRHSEEILEVFHKCQRLWIEDIKESSNNLEHQSQVIQNNLDTASLALLEASSKTKSCIEVMDVSLVQYQQKLEISIHDIFGVIDQHLAGITKSLGESAAEIADTAKAVPRAMRTVIEEMKQGIER